ncbi:hypothetical protein F4804DRAFT_76154 [Jackrogersella minutella]|nr:hypothetical protein F4804DRAFT_76154 [Jackrogersella minutella]
MATTSQNPVNGSVPSTEAVAATQTDRVSSSAYSIPAYTTSVSSGDAPINTLLQHQTTQERLATRVKCEVEDARAKLN